MDATLVICQTKQTHSLGLQGQKTDQTCLYATEKRKLYFFYICFVIDLAACQSAQQPCTGAIQRRSHGCFLLFWKLDQPIRLLDTQGHSKNKLVPKMQHLYLLTTISSIKKALVNARCMYYQMVTNALECSQSSSLLITILPRGVIPSLIPTPHNVFPGGLSMSLDAVNSYLGGLETPPTAPP